ncbi:MAG: M28 family peptidase [Pseudomonadota bacterium]
MINNSTLKLAGLTLLLIFAYLFRGVSAQAPAVDPDHPFDTDRALARLERILGDETPHPVDSDANDAVLARLITEIEALGFEPFVRDNFHCRTLRRQARCMRLQNVGFWVTEPGPNAVMIASHHDSVPAGPGASDDGAGYASSLEIAAILKDRELTRPLLVLITDGEEAGLMGAHMFARTDPLANQIGAVVNLEARGVRGLSSLIQTSHPNERDIAALISETRLPISNSLNTDIYELMPNDTDMTEFLSLQIDAANLAYAEGVEFYHTPGDNLANMDKRALFNIGANAFSITAAYLDQTETGPEDQLLYADLFGRVLLVLPVWLGGVFLVIGAILSLALTVRRHGRGKIIRAVATPVLAIMAGLILATAVTMLIGAIRSEQLFGSAYPMALRGTHASAMALSCLASYLLIAKNVPKAALYGGGWFWFSALALIAFVFVKGSASLFALTAITFGIASILFLIQRQRAGEIIAFLGVLLFAAIAFPTTALGETGLLIENAAPFSIIIGFLLIVALPAVWPEDANVNSSALLGSPALLLSGFFIASLIVPAYTAEAPRGFNIVHVQDENSERGPVWTLPANEPLPKEVATIADFERSSLAGSSRPYFVTPGPEIEKALTAALLGDETTAETRQLAVQIAAPDADYTALTWSIDAVPTAARINGHDLDLEGIDLRNVSCFGRSCRGITLELTFPAETELPGFSIDSYTFGLPPSADFLKDARPDWALPVHYGDMQMLRTRFEIDGFDKQDN